MDFGEALKMLKNGRKMCRKGWNGKSQYIALHKPSLKDDMSKPYIYIFTVDRTTVPWLASQTDMLEEDWVVFDEVEFIENEIHEKYKKRQEMPDFSEKWENVAPRYDEILKREKGRLNRYADVFNNFFDDLNPDEWSLEDVENRPGCCRFVFKRRD